MKKLIYKEMKKIFTTIVALSVYFIAGATVHTVSNNAYTVGMFDAVQDAIDAANPGDTVILVASNINYGSFTVTKSLSIIGAGYAVEGNISEVGGITLDTAPGDLSALITDVYFSGLKASWISGSGYNINTNNVTIENCFFTSSGISISNSGTTVDRKGWIIQNNVFINGNVSIYDPNNDSNYDVIIRNNIFTATSNYVYGFKRNTLITNNVFIGSSSTSDALWDVENLVITNNIFYNITPRGADYCNFTNNISYGGETTSFSYANNTGSNLLEATDPKFKNVPGFTFDPVYDYRLQDTSPGKNAGSDGKDVGAYGGDYPFPYSPDNAFPDNTVPGFPAVLEMDVQNGSLKKDEILKVKIKAISNN